MSRDYRNLQRAIQEKVKELSLLTYLRLFENLPLSLG